MRCSFFRWSEAPLGSTLFVFAWFAVFGFSSTAFADGGSVRYSYETVEIGEDKEGVLIPIPSSELEGDVDKGMLEKTFDELKSDKSNTYGGSSIRVLGAGTDERRVEVRIDDDKKQYHLIIKAESVYTLTELGVEEVYFPQYKDKGLTRKDIPFSVYTLDVPLWRAVPPTRNLVRAEVLMPDGSLVPVEKIYRKWETGDTKLRSKVLSYLESDEDYVVVSLLSKLSKFEGLFYVEEVLPLLKHESTRVRGAALKALNKNRNEGRVLKAVVSLMRSEEGSKLGKKASEFLSKSGNPKYSIHRQYFLLKHGSEKEVIEALETLGSRKPTDETLTFVYDQLGTKTEKIRMKTADTLDALEADNKQMAALEDDDISDDVKTRIAKDMANDEKIESKIAGHAYRARNNNDYKAIRAIESLRSIGTKESRKIIESFLTDKSDSKRSTAAKALVELGQSASISAMVEAYEKTDDSILKASVIELLDKQNLDTVLTLTESGFVLVRKHAYGALGGFVERKSGAKDRIFEALKKGIESSEPAIRSAAVSSLGPLRSDRALKIIKSLKGDDSPQVRAGVATALGYYDKMTETLYSYLEDSSVEPKAAAMEALARRGDESRWSTMMKLAETADNTALRASALRAIGQLVPKNKETRQNVISLLSGAMSDSNPEVQLAALEQLGRFKSENAVTSIAIKLGSDKRRIKLEAIQALGKTGHERAVEVLSGTLTDPDPEIREAVVRALGQIGGGEAKDVLLERLEKEDDQEIVSLIKETVETI